MSLIGIPELDALELDVEEEGPSYLSDLNKVPDFVDEPPVEVPEVCTLSAIATVRCTSLTLLQTPEQKEAVKTTV